MNKKGPLHYQKHVVTKHDDFPITFSIRFYNSLYYRTSRDTPYVWLATLDYACAPASGLGKEKG